MTDIQQNASINDTQHVRRHPNKANGTGLVSAPARRCQGRGGRLTEAVGLSGRGLLVSGLPLQTADAVQDVHQVDGRPGERHPVLAEPLTEHGRLRARLLRLLPALSEVRRPVRQSQTAGQTAHHSYPPRVATAGSVRGQTAGQTAGQTVGQSQTAGQMGHRS